MKLINDKKKIQKAAGGMRKGLKVFLAAALLICSCVFPAFSQTVEYGNLRELLTEGNADLKENAYYTNLGNVEHQLEVLRQECQDMVALSKIHSDEPGTSDEYQKTAESLNKTIKQLEKRLKSLTGTNASINTTIDLLHMSAQSSMISLMKMETNARAKEKEAQAAALKYQNMLTRQSAGMAQESDVLEAHAAQLNAEASASSFRAQADILRRDLLQMLGLPDDGSVSFAEIPVPGEEELLSVKYEADLEASANKDSAVRNIRHRRSDSTAAMNLKASSEEEAVGNAQTDYIESYTLLQTRIEGYRAAVKGMAAAENEWQGKLRKQAAGMLTQADLLSAEAAYINAQAAMQNAALELRAAYDQYGWLVKGVA